MTSKSGRVFSILDILVHLPREVPRNMPTACIAHVLEYNISSVGGSLDEAVGNAIDLAADHQRLAEQMGISPICIAPEYLLRSFMKGVPVEHTSEDVEVRVSRAFAKKLAKKLAIRDIREQQEKSGYFDLEKFSEQYNEEELLTRETTAGAV